MITIPGRIPIRIFPLFWVLILLIGWVNSESVLGTSLWALAIFFSILFHEYGHALTARAFGQEAEIDLVGFGGLTRRSGGPPLKKWQEFVIVLDGPLAGFIIFALAYYITPLFKAGEYSLIIYLLSVLKTINLIWSALNLIPVLPLDGGHLLRIGLESIFGINGLKISTLISVILGVALGLFFFSYGLIIAGAIFFMFAFESYRAWSQVKSMTSQDQNTELQTLFQQAQQDVQEGRQDEAMNKLYRLREQTRGGNLHVLATQYLGHLLAQKGQLKQAYDMLLPIETQLPSTYLRFLQQLAYRLQEWEQAIKIGNRAYRSDPVAETALINALSYAIMGQTTPAVGWLRSAIKLGLPNLPDVLAKREFDAIRQTPEFKIIARLQ